MGFKNDFPVQNLGKSMFLILMGETPTRTILENSRHSDMPRTVCFFPRQPLTLRRDRLFKVLMEHTLDIVRTENRAPSPEELVDKADELWTQFEAAAAATKEGATA